MNCIWNADFNMASSFLNFAAIIMCILSRFYIENSGLFMECPYFFLRGLARYNNKRGKCINFHIQKRKFFFVIDLMFTVNILFHFICADFLLNITNITCEYMYCCYLPGNFI